MQRDWNFHTLLVEMGNGMAILRAWQFNKNFNINLP